MMAGEPVGLVGSGSARRRRGALALAPLIDVTFILLIFFMLVTRFSDLAPVAVTLGDVARAAPPIGRDAGGRAGAIRLVLGADGSVRLDGRHVAGLDGLEQALRRLAAGAGDGAAPRLVLIAPEPDVPLQSLLDALVTVQGIAGLAPRMQVPPRDASGAGAGMDGP